MKNVTLRQLRTFSSAARHQSFARAAEELHLTAPAVSMQIKELEAEVGLPLFDRVGRSISLTVTGEYLLAHTRRVLAAMKDAEDTVARFRGLQGGELVIGLVSTAQYFVPALLAQFRNEHPGVRVRLRIGNREQLVALMQANEVDLAVMGRPPREWATRAEAFAPNALVLITSREHPFAQLEHVSALALSREPLIVREQGSGTRAALEEYFREHRLEMQPVMELPSNETIKHAVMAGLGVSLLSRHTIALELSEGLIATPEVEDMPIRRSWHIVNNLSKALSPAAEAFRYFVLERGGLHLAERLAGSEAGRPLTQGEMTDSPGKLV
jgi:DNA-binding transcriptional LysR family regulator